MSERVLVVMERCLGDTVMTLPLIELLETRWPSITYLGPGNSRLILGRNPNRLFMDDMSGRSLMSDFQNAARLRKEGFDIAIVSKSSFRAAWIVRLSGIKRRIGHAGEARTMFLTDPVPYERSAYFAYSMLDLARPLGFTVRLRRPKMQISEGLEEARVLLDGATIGIQPGASSEKKRISMETLADLTRYIQAKGFRVAFLGGPEEQGTAQTLAERLDTPIVNLVGKTNLRALAGVLSNLKLVIGADTGVLHLAAAVGSTTVQVFGPTVYKGWGNAYGSNQVLVAPFGDVKNLEKGQLLEAVDLALNGASI